MHWPHDRQEVLFSGLDKETLDFAIFTLKSTCKVQLNCGKGIPHRQSRTKLDWVTSTQDTIWSKVATAKKHAGMSVLPQAKGWLWALSSLPAAAKWASQHVRLECQPWHHSTVLFSETFLWSYMIYSNLFYEVHLESIKWPWCPFVAMTITKLAKHFINEHLEFQGFLEVGAKGIVQRVKCKCEALVWNCRTLVKAMHGGVCLGPVLIRWAQRISRGSQAS